MEFISSTQLQRYDKIIDQIKSETEKYELFKKELEKENDNIILTQLACTTISQKLSHMNIQVFSNLIDLLNLYGDEVNCNFLDMMRLSRCKFYLIEVYVTKSLMQKARRLNCLLNISVKLQTNSVNKTVVLTNKVPTREIIPVDENIMDSIIEASLLIPSADKYTVIKLDTVLVDISYHFEMYKSKQEEHHTVNDILQLNSLYNKYAIQNLQKPIKSESKLFCDIEKDFFISTVLENCYHALDIELFFELKNDTEKDFVLKLSNGINTFNIVLNMSEKYIKIVADISNLYLLKKYFHKEFYKQEKTKSNLSLENTEIWKLKIDEMSVLTQEVCPLYHKVRDAWAQLRI